MLESKIEKYLRTSVEKIGGICWKFESPGRRGVPDRLIVLPGNHIAFAETKAPGKQEGVQQEYRATTLRKLGCTVFSTVDGFEKVDGIIQWCRKVVGE